MLGCGEPGSMDTVRDFLARRFGAVELQETDYAITFTESGRLNYFYAKHLTGRTSMTAHAS